MKKRAISLFLALVLCLGLAASALAAEFKPEFENPPESDEAEATRELVTDAVMQLVIQYCPEMKDVEGGTPFADCENPKVLQAVSLGIVGGVSDDSFDPDAPIQRISWAVVATRAADTIKREAGVDLLPAPAGDTANQFGDIKQGDATAAAIGRMVANGAMSAKEEGAFAPGDSVTVKEIVESINVLIANGEKAAEAPAETETPAEGETPAAPETPAEAAGMAYASTQTVNVDGEPVEFQMYALKDVNGNPTNYVKARDVACILNGTKAQFEVGYDNIAKAVDLIPGQAYTANGSEMKTPFSGDREYTIPTGVTKVNGRVHSLQAILLTSDSGGGFTYYKLRDLGKALGFNVSWSKEKGVFIESDKPYEG